MNARVMIVTAGLVFALMSVVGCEPQDTQLRVLTRDKGLLTQQNDQLRTDIKSAGDQLAISPV